MPAYNCYGKVEVRTYGNRPLIFPLNGSKNVKKISGGVKILFLVLKGMPKYVMDVKFNNNTGCKGEL